MPADQTAEPFTIAVEEDVLKELNQRLALTRWTDEIPDSGWTYGSNLSYMKELIAYWQDGYDWRTQEKMLNSFPQYTVELDDIRLHYLHVPGVGPDPMPLILSHGWPGSITEFTKIIGPLTDPAAHGGDPKDAFTVVAPSLPGYGFSHVPNQRRLSAEEMVDKFHCLMTDILGYDKFMAQGGDWGGLLTSIFGFKYPENVVAIHLNMIATSPDQSDISNLSPAETAFLQQMGDFKDETAYTQIQGTKPLTLGYGLNDSPVGLAAWITEKFYTWTDSHGDIESSVSKDDLLNNIVIYWITQTIQSSFWLYYQSRQDAWKLPKGEKVTVPTAVGSFPAEIARPPREWVERTCNVTHWTDMESGGHFAALEEPELLAGDLRSFLRSLR